MQESYKTIFQAEKLAFLTEWTRYWTSVAEKLKDTSHELEHDDLYKLKMVHVYDAQALFRFDIEYKWDAEKRMGWMTLGMSFPIPHEYTWLNKRQNS
jgi:hypothetical protein